MLTVDITGQDLSCAILASSPRDDGVDRDMELLRGAYQLAARAVLPLSPGGPPLDRDSPALDVSSQPSI
jgi:hypothetical protein